MLKIENPHTQLCTFSCDIVDIDYCVAKVINNIFNTLMVGYSSSYMIISFQFTAIMQTYPGKK